MPSSHRRSRRTPAASADGGLRVFSIDRTPLDALKMARLLTAIAAERQAQAEGRPAPHVAGLDKLADLRPEQPDAAGTGGQETEAPDA